MGLLKKLGLVSYPIQNWEEGKKFYGETLGLPVAWFQGDEAGWIQNQSVLRLFGYEAQRYCQYFRGTQRPLNIPQSPLFCYACANPPAPRNSRCDDEHGYQRTTHDSRC